MSYEDLNKKCGRFWKYIFKLHSIYQVSTRNLINGPNGLSYHVCDKPWPKSEMCGRSAFLKPRFWKAGHGSWLVKIHGDPNRRLLYYFDWFIRGCDLWLGISTGNPRVIPGWPVPVPIKTLTRLPSGWVNHGYCGYGYTMGTPTGCIHVHRYKYIHLH